MRPSLLWLLSMSVLTPMMMEMSMVFALWRRSGRPATTPAGRTAGRDALKGDADPFRWDENVMRVTQFKGDAVRFYEFLNELLTDYSPLLTRHSGERAYIDPTTGLVHGGYWSRGIGASIVVCLGPKDTFDQSVAAARWTGNDEDPAGRERSGVA